MLVWSAWTGPPASARTGWDTCPASLAPLLRSSTRKKHQARRLGGPRTLRFVGLIRFDGFNFGQIKNKVHRSHGSVIFIWSS